MGILSFSDEYAYSISFGLIFEKSLLSPKVSIDGMMFKLIICACFRTTRNNKHH